MRLQYITDNKGRKSALQMSLKDWHEIPKKLKELETLRNKKAFLVEVKEAVAEVKLAKQGKIKLQSAKDFIDEL